ncbi:MAG: hypothetical protein ACREBC_27530 [Pyrinomonadaceae bacterium]
MKTELPIACRLSEPALQERRSKVLQETAKSILEVKELENGFAYRFPADDGWLEKLNEFIRFERRCCPFLGFKMIVEPNDGPIWLELTGPDGVKEFLASLFS